MSHGRLTSLLFRSLLPAALVVSPVMALAQTAPLPGATESPGVAVPPGAAPAVTVQPPAVAPEKPTVVVKTWKDLLVVDGLVDAYYMYNFTGHTSLTPATGVRNFDLNSNTFTLNYAKLGFGVTPEPVGVRIDFGYGATGQIINSALGAADANAASPFLVQQAYASLLIPGTPVTVDFGKFVTSAGAEVIEANRNWLYSRSILFFNIPLLHNGLRVTAKLSDALSVQASVVNGWNGAGINPDLSKDKTYGVSVFYTAPTKTAVALNTYFGKETSGTDFRFLGDLVVNQELSDRLALNLNVDYVTDEAAGFDHFIGAALMGRYLAADHLTLAARGELARNGDRTVGEGTVMLGVPFENRFEARAEVRADFADTDLFDPHFDAADPSLPPTFTDKNQVTALVAFLGWF